MSRSSHGSREAAGEREGAAAAAAAAAAAIAINVVRGKATVLILI